jgi:hypothetical protein
MLYGVVSVPAQTFGGLVDAGRETREYPMRSRGRGRGREMKGRKRKDGTNAIIMNGEVRGDGGKNRLENENMRVNSTCRVRTAEKGTLATTDPEDGQTKLHQAGCNEKSENDKIWWV